LALGVTIGVWNSPEPAPPLAEEPRMEVQGPTVLSMPAFAGVTPTIDIAGPDRPAPAGEIAIDVFGLPTPPPAALADGEERIESPFPDYASIFNANVVVERPSRVVVAGVGTGPVDATPPTPAGE
jgi:hypothetical protein